MGANQGRAKGNKQEAEYENRKEGMRDQAGEKGKTEEAKAETGTGKAAVRRNREEKERKTEKLSSQNRKRSGRKKAEEKGKARKRRGRKEPEKKGSTCGTAVGAKQGRTKGNEQEAEYENLEGRHERSGRRERGKRRSESGSAHGSSHCEAENRKRRKGRNRG